MNDRIIITPFLFAAIAIAIVAIVFFCGCAPVLTGPKNNDTVQKDSDLTLQKKQVEWQKMKKWRSVHGGWIEDISVGDSKKPVGIGEPGQSRHIRILTLSEKQIALLDWHGSNSGGARMKNKRILPGRGVEFDIYFPGNSPGDCSLDFVSSGEGGSGSLVGTDIRGYGAIALKFTLVSVNGTREPTMKQKLIAGVVIGPTNTGRLSAYEPFTLSMADSEKTVIAKTYTSTDKIYEIGFHVHMLNPQDWDASGSMITLRADSAGND
jgi:hypothetical protein